MNKIGVNLKIKVTELDKARFFVGKKATYCDLTVFIDPDNPGQYGDHGMITQQGEKGEKMPPVGNATVFWKEGQEQVQQQGMAQVAPVVDDLSDIPF